MKDNPQQPGKKARGMRSVLPILSDGKPHSSRELVIKAKVSDARKAISQLRRKGWYITDEWQQGKDKTRYKLYKLEKEGKQ